MRERIKSSIKGIAIAAGVISLATAGNVGVRVLWDKYEVTEAMRNFLHSCADSDEKALSLLFVMAIIIFVMGYACGKHDAS